ncbi:MAG: iron-sulfur cluster-binding protein [Acidobacteriales bacterium]|nr:MAG: iron-sulfur cluster-binding protein [Terriglobales bacterium]
MSAIPEEKIQETLANPNLQAAIYSSTGRLMSHRKQVVSAATLPDYQELRDQAQALKKQTLDNLDFYLEQFETQVNAHGGKVIWCKEGAEVAEFLARLAREKDAKLLVKVKSMTSEEIELNEHLEREGLEVVETDLGEFIVQLARCRPYHIVAPALHLTRHDVADLFTKTLGVARETVPENQCKIARAVLREKFLSADIGVSGANFLVADSGAIVTVTNEGNGRMCTTMPRIHVAVAGIEKLIPRAQDLAVFLKLLGRSATGQPLTVYTSILSGPRRKGEVDGPEEFYVVLLDNGRTRLLADREKRQSLYCIRCGACLNHCPVYRKIGGHNYPWVYSGPIGSVISPQFRGIQQDPWLPFASSLCGACAEVCPVKIDIPKLLLDLRSEVVKAKTREGQSKLERLAFRGWAWLMRHPRLFQLAGRMGSLVMRSPGKDQWLRRVPFTPNVGPLGAWTSERDLPPMPPKSFRQLWKARKGGSR